MMTVHCPCGKRLRAKEEMAGRVAKCPNCGAKVELPAPELAEIDIDAPRPPIIIDIPGMPAEQPATAAAWAQMAIATTVQYDPEIRAYFDGRERIMRWQMAGFAVACLAGSFLMSRAYRSESPIGPDGIARFGQIEARGVTIKDREGKPRILIRSAPWQMGFNEVDDTMLTMLDRDGKTIVELYARTDNRTDLVLGEEGRDPIILGTSSAVSTLHLGNPSGKPGGTVGLRAGQMSDITISDHDSKPLIEMMAEGSGSSLQLFDSKGRTHAGLQYYSGDFPKLILRDERGISIDPSSAGLDEPGSRRP